MGAAAATESVAANLVVLLSITSCTSPITAISAKPTVANTTPGLDTRKRVRRAHTRGKFVAACDACTNGGAVVITSLSRSVTAAAAAAEAAYAASEAEDGRVLSAGRREEAAAAALAMEAALTAVIVGGG